MAVQISFNFLLFVVVLLELGEHCKCIAVSHNCGTVIKSSCPDKGISKWNRKNVAGDLKAWFKSVEKVLSVRESDLEHYSTFDRRRVVQDEETKVIKYIGNFDCANKKAIGPTWKIGGQGRSRNQFHDGFLYGMHDENRNFTGM